jgi:hypothetical protein
MRSGAWALPPGCALVWALATGACAGPTVREAAVAVAPAPDPAESLRVDLDGDGRPDWVDVYRSRDGQRGLLALRRAEGEPAVSRLYPLWAAYAGHLGRDGREQVVLGAWSRTRRHDEQEPHRTIWVVGWRGDRFVDLWRGSALARPLRDFRVADLDGDGIDELLALESRRGGGCMATAYAWTGFGFRGLARVPLDCTAAQFCGGAVDPPAGAGLCPAGGAPRRRAVLHGDRLGWEERE